MTEVYAGDIVHKTAVGRTPAVSGTMTIAGGKVTQAAVTAQMQQLTSNRAARDNYIHSHGIDSDSFPTAVFRLTTPITLPQPNKGAEIDAQAAGTLTLHGVTRPITIPLKSKWFGDKIQVVGTAPIMLADYQIQPPDTGVVKVDDHGSLELSLTFVRR
jgi:polyisoprenoid-binding protein YceI